MPCWYLKTRPGGTCNHIKQHIRSLGRVDTIIVMHYTHRLDLDNQFHWWVWSAGRCDVWSLLHVTVPPGWMSARSVTSERQDQRAVMTEFCSDTSSDQCWDSQYFRQNGWKFVFSVFFLPKWPNSVFLRNHRRSSVLFRIFVWKSSNSVLNTEFPY